MISKKNLLYITIISFMVLIFVLLLMMANIKEETERLCDYYIDSYCECLDPESLIVPNVPQEIRGGDYVAMQDYSTNSKE